MSLSDTFEGREGSVRDHAAGLVRWATQSLVVVVVLAVIVGLTIAVPATQVLATEGTVAVIPLEGSIDGESAAAFSLALEQARADPDIDAVVLLVNSPGGTASASETLYLEVSKTATEIPVVTSVDSLAASGAYYAAVGSDRIYAKPASLVGSVGVLFVPPPEFEPTNQIVTTGPSKLAGASERGWLYKTESLKLAFVGAVVEGRGDALVIPPEEVATAELFTGAEAVENGMADELGGTRDAIEYAADQAGLSSYNVTVLRPDGDVRFLTRSAYLASDAPNKTLIEPSYFIGEVGTEPFPNYLYLPAGIFAEAPTTEVNGTDD
jgi:protease-4